MHTGDRDGRLQLGIDFGTSSTVAVIATAGRAPRPLLFDGSPLLPSAVCLDPAGQFLTGRDALHTAMSSPAAFEPHPKQRIDDGTVLLAGSEVPVARLYQAVLTRVLTAARSTLTDETAPIDVVLTCPAGWGQVRREVLAGAAPPLTRLLDEPVAAAHHLAHVAADRIPDGGRVLIYDFGAGTIDTAVVRRHGDSFSTETSFGASDCGGLDIDAAIVRRLRASGSATHLWDRLDQPQSAIDRRARHQLWQNVRTAKEMLSRASMTLIHLPLLDVEVPLGREELDELAAPVIARTVATVEQTLTAAGITAAELSAMFLCGGSSRLPAVATALHRAFGIAPTTVEQPELAVAEGSVRVRVAEGNVRVTNERSAATAEGNRRPAAPGEPQSGPTVAGRRRLHRRPVLFAGVITGLLGLAGALTVLWPTDDSDGTPTTPQGQPSASADATPPPGIDPCLLGTWRITFNQVYGLLDGERVQYTGGEGTLTTYGDDGWLFIDFTNQSPRMADHNGVIWSDQARGTVSGRYYAEDGVLTETYTRIDATVRLYRAGELEVEKVAGFTSEPIHYRCTADELFSFSEQGNFSTHLVRVESGPSVTPPPLTDWVPPEDIDG